MSLHGVEKHHELRRSRVLRDVRPLHEQAFEMLATLPALAIVYVCFVFLTVFAAGLFDVWFLLVLAYSAIPMMRRPDVPFRVRQSLGEMDHADIDPSTKRPQKGRGIAFIGNRKSDNAEVWLGNGDARQHFFVAGSTGAGKTEALISLAYNSLVWGSGFAYTDGKGDVSLWSKIFSMVRAMGREDDLLVINYMTGGADTTKRRADRISNTYNPFSVGNSDSLVQLLVGLMDGSDGKSDMWKGRAISFISALIPPLVELRDKGLLMLHIGAIRKYLPFPRFNELMAHPEISDRAREVMEDFLSDVPGYKKEKGESQAAGFYEQYGYQQMQFTRILSSLGNTYGYIYNTPLGEINLEDIVVNRRILVVLLPALEKSDPELANLGKVIVAGFSGMMGVQLGNKLEGTKTRLLDARATNSPTPFIGIFDEFGYYMPEGAAKMWAQARSLGFSLVASGQDLQAFYRTSKEETLAIIGSSNFKVFGKVEDPTDTLDLVEKLAGEAYVSVVDGFNVDTNGIGGYQGGQGARVERVKRVELQDLKDQIEGEVHIIVKSQIIRARMFYAAPKQAKQYRLNHFLRVAPPTANEVQSMRVDVAGILQAIEDAPPETWRPTDGLFDYVSSVRQNGVFEQYARNRQGIERGICLLMHFNADVRPSIAGGEGEGGSSGAPSAGHHLAPGLGESPAGLAPGLLGYADDGVPEGPPVLVQGAGSEVVYDAERLEAVSVFGARDRVSGLADLASLADAASSLVGLAIERPVVYQGVGGEEREGTIDRTEVEVRLQSIALGLGASRRESQAVAEGIVSVAVGATEYPLPPRPEKVGAGVMESTINDLESLILDGGRQ